MGHHWSIAPACENWREPVTPSFARFTTSFSRMAKFLNTSATNCHLEELIKGARDRLILISPFLKLNDRIKELLADKDRLKIDVRMVYGKSELAPAEIEWLKGLTFVRTSFCKNLHAKVLFERGGVHCHRPEPVRILNGEQQRGRRVD
jgi:hypothetical protein